MNFPVPGEIFANKYRIDDLLGKGGFSRVYRAIQIDIDRPVALKILRPPIYAHTTEVERQKKLEGLTVRFNREAKMMSKLRSPHTIIMYDYGQTEDGLLFMVIEYIDGMDLTNLIRRHGATEPERVAKILKQVLISLHEAHQLGMLHRDIKPQNIMIYNHLGLKDQVKLLDFGIVKLIDEESKSDMKDLTDDGTLVGTPRYMSPEYIRGARIGPPSDIYSMGLVVYELLVGAQAITAESSIQIIGKQLEPQSFFLPDDLPISAEFRRIINRMLHKDPTQRYQNAEEILHDIEAMKEAGLPELDLSNPEVAVDPFPIQEQSGSFGAVPLSAATTEDPTSVLGQRTQHNGQNNTRPVAVAPMDTFDDLDEPPEKSNNMFLFGLVGLVCLVVVVAIGAVVMSKNNKKTTPTEPKQLAQKTPKAEPKQPAAPKMYAINTEPAGAFIQINGVAMGKSPLKVTDKLITFPAKITATLGQRTMTQTFASAQDVSMKLPPLVVAKDNPETKPENPVNTTETKTDDKPKSVAKNTSSSNKGSSKTRTKTKKTNSGGSSGQKTSSKPPKTDTKEKTTTKTNTPKVNVRKVDIDDI